MNRRSILELKQVLESLMAERMDPETAYALASAFGIVDTEATTITKIYKPVDGFDEYKAARDKVVSNHKGQRGENGSITIPPDQVQSFYKEVRSLDEKYSEVVSQQKEYDSEFDSFLDEQCGRDFDFVKINKKELPEIEPAKILALMKAGLIE